MSGQRPGGNVELFGVKDGHGRWRVFAHQLPHAGGNVGERAATAASRRHASAAACNARYLREWIGANGRRCRLRSRPHPAASPFEVTEPRGIGDSAALATSVLEAARDTRLLDHLDQRSFAVARLTQPVRVPDLGSDWAALAGASNSLSTAPRRETARWATAIATRWPELHGVAYTAATRPSGRAIAPSSPAAGNPSGHHRCSCCGPSTIRCYAERWRGRRTPAGCGS